MKALNIGKGHLSALSWGLDLLQNTLNSELLKTKEFIV